MYKGTKLHCYDGFKVTPKACPRTASALLFSHPDGGHPNDLLRLLKGSPGKDYALQPSGGSDFLLLHKGQVALVISPSGLPLAAGSFAGTFDESLGDNGNSGLGDISRMERHSIIARHESHILLNRCQPDVSAVVMRDVMIWLASLLSPDQIFWGETAAMFSNGYFKQLGTAGVQPLTPELLIKPRGFRSGHHFNGIELCGFHADGAEDLFDLPVSVAQGPLNFADSFGALKDLALDFQTKGDLFQQLTENHTRGPKYAILLDTDEINISVTRIHTQGKHAHPRYLLRCEDSVIIAASPEHEHSTAPDSPEDALRHVMRG